jgi:hypothetical protein
MKITKNYTFEYINLEKYELKKIFNKLIFGGFICGFLLGFLIGFIFFYQK